MEWYRHKLTIPKGKRALFIGDLHGDTAIVDRAMLLYKNFYLVFLGDFLDSFDYGPRKQIDVLESVLSLVKQGFAYSLIGNHELSYLYPDRMKASGYNSATASLMLTHRNDMLNILKPFFVLETQDRPIVITHAGITLDYWNGLGMGDDSINARLNHLTETARNIDGRFYAVGHARGGSARVPGPMWCAWHAEFKPIEAIQQIVGHSCSWQSKTRWFKEDVWIDNLSDGMLKSQPNMPNIHKLIRMARDNGDMNIDCLQHNSVGLMYDPGMELFSPWVI